MNDALLGDATREAALERIVLDTLWMARRYADGRRTYAVGMVNDAIRDAAALGIAIPPDRTLQDPDGMLATDGDYREPVAASEPLSPE